MRPPVVARIQTDANHFRLRPLADLVAPLVVAIHKQRSVCRQQIRQRALLLRHPREVAKKLQMLAPDVRDDAELRGNHFHQRRQFTGMIRADFEHRGAMR